MVPAPPLWLAHQTGSLFLAGIVGLRCRTSHSYRSMKTFRGLSSGPGGMRISCWGVAVVEASKEFAPKLLRPKLVPGRPCGGTVASTPGTPGAGCVGADGTRDLASGDGIRDVGTRSGGPCSFNAWILSNCVFVGVPEPRRPTNPPGAMSNVPIGPGCPSESRSANMPSSLSGAALDDHGGERSVEPSSVDWSSNCTSMLCTSALPFSGSKPAMFPKSPRSYVRLVWRFGKPFGAGANIGNMRGPLRHNLH
mmetsp:Transcript_128717/g.364062  ORF Transcript_128717/g.364062 Transcript_128717/m.364062 type:complete len:251 (-) Transcript_128717:48-800(-)